jgi:hypothetical protein
MAPMRRFQLCELMTQVERLQYRVSSGKKATAGPSTTLRSGRDDASILNRDVGTKQKCQPDVAVEGPCCLLPKLINRYRLVDLLSTSVRARLTKSSNGMLP